MAGRGGTADDLEAAVVVVMALCWFADARVQALLDVEVKPLMVRLRGYEVIAGDGAVRLIEVAAISARGPVQRTRNTSSG